MHWPYGQLPVTPHPLVARAAGTVQVINGRGLLFGWALRATVAATTVDLFDGPAANGLNVGSFSLALAGEASISFSDRGVYFDNGLFVVSAGGTIDGAVYYVAETRLSEWVVDQESRAAIVGRHTQNWPAGVDEIIGG